MKLFVLVTGMLGLAFAPRTVGAGPLDVDINEKVFVWTAPPVDATHGAPTTYSVKCGTATGVYTIIVPVAPVAPATAPPTTLPVKAVLTPGTFFCVVVAWDAFGQSPPSNEVAVIAGYGPGLPTGFGIGLK